MFHHFLQISRRPCRPEGLRPSSSMGEVRELHKKDISPKYFFTFRARHVTKSLGNTVPATLIILFFKIVFYDLIH